MIVYGIDFTSAPGRRKPLTCARGRLKDGVLAIREIEAWEELDGFTRFLDRPGPWIAGLDFPFGFARRFLHTMGWPLRWPDYAGLVGRMSRDEFCATLEVYRRDRPPGDKEHRRVVDRLAGSVSPQKLHRPPVGKMLFEGVSRLIRTDVAIPPVRLTGSGRIVVEAYPGVLARRAVDRRRYKDDATGEQTEAQLAARRDILAFLDSTAFITAFGFHVEGADDTVADPTGDRLDAVLCAAQAAWAWTQRERGFGAPDGVDLAEGWIVDPWLASAFAKQDKGHAGTGKPRQQSETKEVRECRL